MKHLTILVPEGQNNLSSIVGAYKIFSRANEYFRKNGKKEIFRIDLAGISESVSYYEGLFSVHPHTQISNLSGTDLIIIPSLNHAFEIALEQNIIMIEWIRQQYKQGAEIASICTGAFMLAATGVLAGRNCSTHWAAADTFRQMFPEVALQTDQLITDENGIYTNGGAYSFLNFLVYLVEKFYNRETAIYCSKVFQIELDRQSQSPFSIFTGQKIHGDDIIKEAQAYIETNPEERISVAYLSSRFSLSRRTFDRRFIKATGNTPVEYARRVKVEAAKKAFETNRKTINEVMYEVGYADGKAFREVFKKITGMSPLAYRTRYNKEISL